MYNLLIYYFFEFLLIFFYQNRVKKHFMKTLAVSIRCYVLGAGI